MLQNYRFKGSYQLLAISLQQSNQFESIFLLTTTKTYFLSSCLPRHKYLLHLCQFYSLMSEKNEKMVQKVSGFVLK